MTQIYEISLPEYEKDESTDFSKIGKKADEFVATNYPNKWIAIRGVSLESHPGKSLDELVELILEHGTDRYDKNRKSVHYEMDEKFGIELHASTVFYNKDEAKSGHYSKERLTTGSPIGQQLEELYHGAIIDRGYPVVADLLLIYNVDKLKTPPIQWNEKKNEPEFTDTPKPPENSTSFIFKGNKKDALLGIVKIKR